MGEALLQLGAVGGVGGIKGSNGGCGLVVEQFNGGSPFDGA